MPSPGAVPLSGQAFPEVGQALRGVIDAVLARWAAAVRAALPSADDLTFVQIRDDMPKILEHVAHAIESSSKSPTAELEALTPVHGGVRFHQNFRLEELMDEYALLRPIVLEEVTAHLGRAMSVPETNALMAGVDVVIRQASLEFVEHSARQVHAANEAQSKYLSFLSHDLRGGLNGVCLMIEVLKRELSSEPRFQESVGDLDMMRRSIFETIGTMDRFLHAERFRKGKVQVRPSRVNLRHLLMDLSAQFAYQAKDKSVELTFDAPVESSMVSDKDLLMMVLQNVTANAIKYGARGPVRLSAAQQAGDKWRISVADSGPGIAPEKMAALFASFTRGDTQGQPGVGLGLSIARQAADLLGAKLWAESVPGEKGTTFHLEVSPIALA